MPTKNRIKTYFEDGFYHVYNRGVEKRTIFLDKQDFIVFLSLLKRYLTSSPTGADEVVEGLAFARPGLVQKDLHDEIELFAFCLMPNHFHLLLQQKKTDSMTKFLQRVSTSYVIYFNKKYERVGSLFQGPYKAVVIDNENYLLHLSRYIHLNPLELLKVSPSEGETLEHYRWSSYPEYLGQRKTGWVKTDLILSFFASDKSTDLNLKDFNSYQRFVEEYPTQSSEVVGRLTIDD